MELRRSCKMMSYDQWEHNILFPWSSSVLWLAEPTVGRKNAHQHEWAAILHYLGPFAGYFAPDPPTATFYNQPLYCTNNDSTVKSPKTTILAARVYFFLQIGVGNMGKFANKAKPILYVDLF